MTNKNNYSMTLVISLILMCIGVIVSPIAAAKDNLRLREFYLTVDTFDGAAALEACAEGFHVASMWEILEPSNLKYNTTLGKIAGDSGFGPTVDDDGWIRTGQDSVTGDSSLSPGRTNCGAYSSNDPLHFGTVIELPQSSWDTRAPLLTSPWLPRTRSCGSSTRVWCVEDLQ